VKDSGMPFAVPYSCEVTCSTTTVDLLEQETVPMARANDLTLGDVMQAVREEAANEQEALATVSHLLTSGQVRLSDDAIKAMQALLATTNVAA
jgi:hypothetical protein